MKRILLMLILSSSLIRVSLAMGLDYSLISHRLVAAHPSNMVLCPFAINIDLLSENPDIVYIAYRSRLPGQNRQNLKQVESLLREIVTASLE